MDVKGGGQVNGEKLCVTDVVSALRIFRTQMNVPTRMEKRAHWGLMYKKAGKTVYDFGGKIYVADSRHPMLLPKDATYKWTCIEPGECIDIEFECIGADGSERMFDVMDPAFIESAFEKIERRYARKTASSRFEDLRDFYGVLSVLFDEERYAPSSRADIIKPALEHIAENYYDPTLSNDRLARLCGVSTVYFRRVFKDCCGVPPKAYLIDVRIRKAKELLATGYSTVEQVCFSVGYNSVCNFSKIFKEKTGVSPGKYVGAEKG